MWILPKQLMSAFALGTEVLTLDSAECARACARSLMRRSKPSQSSVYLREWKAGNLMRLRSGAISSPSLGQSFLTEWTSSLVATHASHSQQQASELGRTTRDTCGLGSQMELGLCAPESAFSRTLKDTSRWDSPVSSAIWKSWVIRCRGEYLARLNAVRLTNESECTSWPTAAARDYNGKSPGYLFRADGKCRVDQLPVAVDQAETGNWPEAQRALQQLRDADPQHAFVEQFRNAVRTRGTLPPLREIPIRLF